MDAIILLGGPGAGKGTLAASLKKDIGCLHISTGEMLRAVIQSDCEIGQAARACMESGDLVPDALILDLIQSRISREPDDARFLFDGFPRTIQQAEGLQDLLSQLNGKISYVLNLVVAPEVLLPRLCGRRTCKTCGAVYHITHRPPKIDGVCDVDGGELFQRTDDREKTILNRIEVYKKQTAPLIDYYRTQGVLYDIDASLSPAENVAIARDILLN